MGHATGVPTRIWGAASRRPARSRSRRLAEQFARQVLADQPRAARARRGARRLRARRRITSTATIRSIGFVQRASGLRVRRRPGQLSVQARSAVRDRLRGAAERDGRVRRRRGCRAPRCARARRRAAQRARARRVRPCRAPGEEVDRCRSSATTRVLGYRARAADDDRRRRRRPLPRDTSTSRPARSLAVRQLNTYASGTVLLPRRRSLSGGAAASTAPAPRAHVIVNGAPQTTTIDGGVVVGADSGATSMTSARRRPRHRRQQGGDGDVMATGHRSRSRRAARWSGTRAPPRTTTRRSTRTSRRNIAKEYVRANIDAEMPTLDDQITANVNIAQDCNAFFDGKAINFFHASSTTCQNTGADPGRRVPRVRPPRAHRRDHRRRRRRSTAR